jgi:Domain of unknown function (DUF4381)
MKDALHNDPLAALRPLHPPTAVHWWPPAPGWWLLAVALAALLVLAWWQRRRRALQRVALAELRRLDSTEQDPARLAAGVNQLLRRVALACFPRRQVAALCGEAWLNFLDAHAGAGGFAQGPGRVLLTAPYTPGGPLDRAALVTLARQWIRHQRRSGS